MTGACAHTRPEAPDLSVLLPELKLEAGAEIAAPAQANGEPGKPEMTPEPEATAEPEAAPEPAAQSADIPEEYQGTWYGLSMELDGETYPLADLGLDVTVTIGADGTAEMNMGGDVDHRQCAMQDGALVAGRRRRARPSRSSTRAPRLRRSRAFGRSFASRWTA